MSALRTIGETTLTSKNQISLPAQGMRDVRWQAGDRVVVEVLSQDIILLVRRPKDWTSTFAGRLSHVFGTHEETLAWLDQERRNWGDEPDNDDGHSPT